MKLAICGVGRLGSAVAFLALLRLQPKQIQLMDVKDLEGDILDLEHAAYGLGINTRVTHVVSEPDLLVVALGFPRRPEEPLEVNEGRNKVLLQNAIQKMHLKKGTPIVILTNPVNKMYLWTQQSFPEYLVWNIEPLLMEYRDYHDTSQTILETKGYTNWGPATACVEFIRRYFGEVNRNGRKR